MGLFSGIKNVFKDVVVDDVLGIDDSGGINGTLKEHTGITLNPIERIRNPLKAFRDPINKIGELFGEDHITDKIVDSAGGMLGESKGDRAAREAEEARAEARANVVTPLPELTQSDVLIGSPEINNTPAAVQSDNMITGFSDKLKGKTTALGGLGKSKGFEL